MKIELRKTDRGFVRGEFIDLALASCSIQESSLGTDSALWLGVNYNAGRMHLTVGMVKELIPLLQTFVATGLLEQFPLDAQAAPETKVVSSETMLSFEVSVRSTLALVNTTLECLEKLNARTEKSVSEVPWLLDSQRQEARDCIQIGLNDVERVRTNLARIVAICATIQP